MTKDDITRMARAAGWSGLYMTYNEPTGNADWEMVKESLTVPVTMEQIERFAALVAAAERQACAKVCEGRIGGAVQTNDWWNGFKSAMKQCAAAIRARGNT